MAGSVHNFEDVYLEVDDTKYNVSAAGLILEDNAIPVARITIDSGAHAYHSGAPGTFNTPPATDATISLILSWHTQFQKWAVQHKKATFNAVINKKDDFEVPGVGTDEQKIKLEGWPITGAGITGASASGNFALIIELSHPLVYADHSSALLSGFKRAAKFQLSHITSAVFPANWDTIPQAFATIMDQYADITPAKMNEKYTILGGVCPEGVAASVATSRDKLRKMMRAGAKAIRDHLKWTATTYDPSYKAWPMWECFDPMQNELKLCLADTLTGNADATPFEIIANVIGPMWGTIIVPTYWEGKLEMRPYSPWLKPQIRLMSYDVADIEMPGPDPSPVAGIIEQHQNLTSTGDWSVYLKRGSGVSFIVDEVAYVPDGIKPPVVKEPPEEPPEAEEPPADLPSGGRVYHLYPPQWATQAALKNASSLTSKTSGSKAEAALKRATAANGQAGASSNVQLSDEDVADRLIRTRSAVWTHCKYSFMSKFRQNVETRLLCRLLITTPGSALPDNYITPGHVIQLIDAGSPESPMSVPFFDFYCKSVVHMLDCQNGHASTEITGAYVRPVGEFKDIVVSGDLNPLYTP